MSNDLKTKDSQNHRLTRQVDGHFVGSQPQEFWEQGGGEYLKIVILFVCVWEGSQGEDLFHFFLRNR